MENENVEQTLLDKTLEGELNTPNETTTEETGNEAPVVEVPKEPEIDYKEKFSASTRENQRILNEKSKTDERIATLTKEEMPTIEEMAEVTPNWDLLTDFEQQTAMKVEQTARLTRKMRLEQLEKREAEQWQIDLSKTVKDNPELKDYQDEFKEFCYSPKNKNASIDILASAFLHNKAKTKPIAPKEPKENFTAIDPASNPSGGALRVTPMTDDEAELIRKTDPDRYKELIKKGILK